MTNAIQIFSNPDFGDIRTLMIEEEPWWVGKDVATALQYSNSSKAVSAHVDNEDRKIEILPYSQNGNTVGRLTIINESGLYSLILSSKLPSAKKFKRWVTSEVLPALRKTGSYAVQGSDADRAEQRQLTVDDYIRAASIIAGCRNERMPVVLALLEKGGLDIPLMQDIPGDYDLTGETAALINMAINEYGISQARIAKLCGLHPTQIMRIRSGEQKPKKDRARIIQDVIRHEMNKTT